MFKTNKKEITTMRRVEKMLGTIALAGAAVVFAACAKEKIEGTWVQPVPGMENMTQGFVLTGDGKASSVSMATLQYETWQRDGDRLILTGKSIGNGQTIAFSDTLDIVELTADKLTLKRGDLTLEYQRQQ